MELEVALSLPRDVRTVPMVRAIAVDALRRLGVADGCIDDIRLALSEAVTNVVDHAASDDDYEVRLRVHDLTCSISVYDRGRGFDGDALLGAMPDGMSARGRGVAIMHAVLDSVRFESHPEQGTGAHLVKTLDVVEGSPLAHLL